MQLSADQLNSFSTILQDAFNLFRFDEMLSYRLGINRENIALGNSVPEIIYRVFGEFQRIHTTTDLVMAAREANPHHPALLAFAQQFRLAPSTLIRRDGVFAATASGRELEREIRKANSSFDPVKWRTQLGQVEAQICRIEIAYNGGGYGTGFLVGPDVVMTNYHVVRELMENRLTPDKVLLRFDYKKSEDGTTINSGTIYQLDPDDWRVDESQGSPVDELVDPQAQVPGEEELDYALLRVDGSPGTDKVGGAGAAPSAPTRKWLKLTSTAFTLTPDAPLYIMQHPQGEPLKLAIDTNAIISVNQNGTRVRYRTNTEKGSSGSPCFDKDWQFVALHHSGDPNFTELYKPQYNEGIPTAAIYRLLQSRDKESMLGQ